jgi:hypothetical protein
MDSGGGKGREENSFTDCVAMWGCAVLENCFIDSAWFAPYSLVSPHFQAFLRASELGASFWTTTSPRFRSPHFLSVDGLAAPRLAAGQAFAGGEALVGAGPGVVMQAADPAALGAAIQMGSAIMAIACSLTVRHENGPFGGSRQHMSALGRRIVTRQPL